MFSQSEDTLTVNFSVILSGPTNWLPSNVSIDCSVCIYMYIEILIRVTGFAPRASRQSQGCVCVRNIG